MTNVPENISSDEAKAREILAALWARVSSHYDTHHLVVYYCGKGEGLPGDIAGYFHPDPSGREAERLPAVRKIGIYRDRPPYPADQPEREGPHVLSDLCTLAHEYGHFLSWSKDPTAASWQAYFDTAKRRDAGERLNPDDARRILDEEGLAWRLGREVLEELGLDAWEAFDEFERMGLEGHRERLADLTKETK